MSVLDVSGAVRLPFERLVAVETFEPVYGAVHQHVTVQVYLARTFFRAMAALQRFNNVLALDMAVKRISGDVLAAQVAPIVSFLTFVDKLRGVFGGHRSGLNACFGGLGGLGGLGHFGHVWSVFFGVFFLECLGFCNVFLQRIFATYFCLQN